MEDSATYPDKNIFEENSADVFAAIFNSSAEGILICNKHGVIVLANPRIEEMFGYRKGELIHKKIEVLLPQSLRGGHVKYRETFHHHPSSRPMGLGKDFPALRKDGSMFSVEVSINSVDIQKERFSVAFVTDITLRKQAETQLQQYTQELERSNRELENFAYISSHDLQEPLRKIRAFGDRLKQKERDALSERGQDYIDRMLNSAERMQKLINDLLAFSRITSKAKPFAPVNLDEVMQEVLSDLEIAIEKLNAKVTVCKLPAIRADHTQIRQLFQNLISNALKFSKEDTPPVININCEVITNNDSEKLNIDFVDNGIGFEQKYEDRIFQIFQRLGGRTYEGSGIGLALCKKIVQRHGGDITVQSEVGKGSTFSITLNIK